MAVVVGGMQKGQHIWHRPLLRVSAGWCWFAEPIRRALRPPFCWRLPGSQSPVCAGRGKHSVGLHFLPFLPGVARWGAALPRPHRSFPVSWPYGRCFAEPFTFPLLNLSSSFAAHLRSPLFAAFLLMHGRLPADNRQGFPGLGEGHLEHLLGQERGKGRTRL